MTRSDNHAHPFPGVIRIEPASACTLRCRHCPTGTVAMPRGIMPWPTFEKIVADLEPHRDALRVAVLYHGGEPLLNKEVFRMVEVLKSSLGIGFVKMVSNGMLLDQSCRDQILTCGIDSVEVSVDGRSPAENDHIRRGACFPQIAANVRSLLASRTATGSAKPQVILSSTQFLDPDALSSHAEEAPLAPPPPAWLLEAFVEAAPDEIKTTWAMRWPEMAVEAPLQVATQPGQPARYCDHLVSTLTIRWDGNVVPCCYDLTSSCVVGNVHAESLGDIWTGSRMAELRAAVAAGRPLAPCAHCSHLGPTRYLVAEGELA